MRFVILGAEFNNKGAQAMLFVTVTELRRRFPGCEILFRTRDRQRDGYAFEFFYDAMGWTMLKGGMSTLKAAGLVTLKAATGNLRPLKKARRFIRRTRSADAFIDISGYALSSQRGLQRSLAFIDQIRIAQKLKIPYFVMPQSIGPFDYGADQARMDGLLKRYLSYPVIIYPREAEGYKLLTERYGLTNVTQSYDLVLQNRGVDLDLIYSDPGAVRQVPKLAGAGCVALIPNMKSIEFSTGSDLVEVYTFIIGKLRAMGKTVYLITHSGEDAEACRLIFFALSDRQGVYLVEDEFDCLQFNGVIAQCDYMIGSRYHSIVHALKNGVPAVVLGWATKYHDLLAMFRQERFMFDVRGQVDRDSLGRALDDMQAHWPEEKATINSLIGDYQKENCFDVISDYFKNR